MLSPDALSELQPLGVGFESSTPLWYYVLKEAELLSDGLHLGPVGSRIVAEVLIALIRSDSQSYFAAKPRWQPTFGPSTGNFRIVDFLRFAGVDPTSRHAAQPTLA